MRSGSSRTRVMPVVVTNWLSDAAHQAAKERVGIGLAMGRGTVNRDVRRRAGVGWCGLVWAGVGGRRRVRERAGGLRLKGERTKPD